MEMDRLTQRLHPDYIKVSRISGCLTNLILMIGSAVYLLIALQKDWVFWPGWIALCIFVFTFVLFTWIVPVVEYERFKYEVFEEEVEIRSGLIWIRDVLIPMVKVQHVELESGPLMRRYGLAEVKVVTAASTHRIKGLKQAEAEQLKLQVGKLARVVEADE
ncbi:PH domain-containing protein [Paenibacillus sp. ACRRX]|uniref:PH domain-containing protein n=1 Tax=Paenibacillus sp. ACRRX TaxID=2918206 RepID=UPI001EF6FEBC|nr:PH domain-containing protein [Paenibacillus sp. ACRRX]